MHHKSRGVKIKEGACGLKANFSLVEIETMYMFVCYTVNSDSPLVLYFYSEIRK